MIHLKNVSKTFGKNQVLRDINLTLTEGKVYGIVGANGAGKTTLYNCLSGQLTHEGTIFSDHIDLSDNIAYLQTNPYLMSLITGREYIKMICNAKKVVGPKIDAKNIFDLPLDEYASNYSTGMAKKLAFTALLHLNIDLYILDEPFNGVDIQSNMLIVEILKKIKSSGKTILISSHIYSTLEEVCDKILLLENGQIIMTAEQDQFKEIEQKMRDYFVNDKLEMLNI